MKIKANKIIGPVILILLWAVISWMGITSALLLPSPVNVGKSLFKILFETRNNVVLDIGYTSYRTIISFIFSSAVGIPIGLLMGYNVKVYNTFEVVVDFFRSIPAIALFPLFILMLGIDELSKLGVPFYGATLIIIVNSIYGVINAPKLRRTIGKLYGFSEWQILKKIIFPDSLPQVFAGMRTALSLALVLTIVVEMFTGANNGLGKRIYDFHLLFDIPDMYAAIILTGLLGYFFNQGFIMFEKKIVHWTDK